MDASANIEDFRREVSEMYDKLVHRYNEAVGNGIIEDGDCWDYIEEFLANEETTEDDFNVDPQSCYDYIMDEYRSIEIRIDEMYVREPNIWDYDAFDFGDPREDRIA